MSNSALVDYTRISPFKNSPRNHAIDKITIHHMAGNLSVETCGRIFQTKKASSNYGIGSDGRVGMYCEEKDRSWCSSSGANDNRAVTIEVANSEGAPDWPVGEKAYAKLIDLCVDICKRNNIPQLVWTGDANGTLTVHQFFATTACPGPYLMRKMPEIAAEVNKRLGDKPVDPLSPNPVRLKMGYASPGDMAQIEAELQRLLIAYHAADGYAVTDVAVSAGDQQTLARLCASKGVPCVIFDETQEGDNLDARVKELEDKNKALSAQVSELELEVDKLQEKISAAQAALA